MAQYKYLLKPDRRDPRDFLFARAPLLEKLPSSVDLRNKFSQVVNQLDLGSCTANAIASGGMEFLQLKNGLNYVSLSRLFLYYLEREKEGTIGEDAGAELRDGLYLSQKVGVCPEVDWPYIPARFAQTPPSQAYQDAPAHKINSYQRLQSLNDVKRCLVEGYPVIAGIKIFASFESSSTARSGEIPMPRSGEQALGGHAIVFAGYQDTRKIWPWSKDGYLIGRNSWGPAWGDKGYFYLPYAYTKYFMDLWTIR